MGFLADGPALPLGCHWLRGRLGDKRSPVPYLQGNACGIRLPGLEGNDRPRQPGLECQPVGHPDAPFHNAGIIATSSSWQPHRPPMHDHPTPPPAALRAVARPSSCYLDFLESQLIRVCYVVVGGNIVACALSNSVPKPGVTASF